MAKLAAVLALVLAGASSAQELVQPEAPTDINATGPCKADLARLCANVPAGNASKAQCLNKAWSKKEEIALPCQNAMKAFFQKASTSGSLVKRVTLSEACKEDITKFCQPQEVKGNSAFACLKAQKRTTLKPECKEKVARLERMEAKTIELDGPFYTACREDLTYMEGCRDIPTWAPSSGKKSCLMKNKKKLSGACQQALFTRLKSDLTDVRLMPAVFTACQPEIKEKCGSLAFGEARVLKCLWDHNGDASFDCKKEVTLATKEKLSDYRLDYKIRTNCKKDIDTLCQTQEWLVGNLTMHELFGGDMHDWTEGKSGLVLQCLKANFTKIKDPACKPEIKRLVKVHAEAPSLNPVFQRACKDDIATHCSKSPPERIHFCLRNHMKAISPACRKVEITQGSIAAMDISLKPQMERACKQAIKKHCSDVTHGDAMVIQCLQDHLEDEDLGSKCEEIVEDDLEASNHDWRLKFGVHHACMIDAGRLCSEEVPKAAGSVLKCLKDNRNEIESASCKAEMFRFIRQGASNIKFSPTTYNACIEDVAEFCPNVQPGQGRIHECLVKQRATLSFPCASAEFQEQEAIAEDIRLHPLASKLCKTSIKELCPDVAKSAGRIWQCLADKKDDPKMAFGCRSIVASHVKLQNEEFHLNPQLAKHCGLDADVLCPFEAAMANYKEFGSEGETITCLIGQRRNVKDDACKGLLLKKAQQRLANVDNNPEVSIWCSEDIDTFCDDVPKGHGRVNACLKENLGELSPDCKQVTMENLVLQSEDARMLPFMQKDGVCAAAKNRYCADVPAGDGHKIMCMLNSMVRLDMPVACKKELQKLLKLRATNIRFNPMLAKQCKKDLAVLQASHKDDTRCKQQDYQEVALQGRSISCLTEHRQEVESVGCKMAITSIMTTQSFDYRAKPGMQEECEADVAALCPDVQAGTGRVHNCLRSNMDSITSKQCLGMVKSVWEAEKRNAILNPKIRQSCQNAIRTFCPNVQGGEQRLLVCLLQSSNMTGFGASCKQSLKQLKAGVVVPAFAASLQQIMSTRNFWDKWGKVLMGGIAMLLLAWIVCLGFLIRFIRNRRSLYGIQVDQPEANDGGAGQES